MPESANNVVEGIIVKIDNLDPSSDEATAATKNLKTLAEALNLLKPDPIPEPEPTGFRGFLKRNAGDLIKVGGTLTVVSIIAAIEAKGDVIFRSKAAKYL